MSDFWWDGANAVGTTAAFLVAANAYRWQVDTQRKRQAERVVLLVAEAVHQDAVVLEVANYSDLPIYDISIPVVEMYGYEANPESGWREGRVKVLAAGREHQITIGNATRRRVWHLPDDAFAVDFKDTGGREWRRTAAGRLIETTPGRRPVTRHLERWGLALISWSLRHPRKAWAWWQLRRASARSGKASEGSNAN